MPYKTVMMLAMAIAGLLIIAMGHGMAQQQASLGPVGNATVTLYYFDNVNWAKGDIVLMADNPQHVNDDPTLAAPGMYTFSHVPTGQWYYLEANNNGSTWYTIFEMGEGMGTKTANVHIPWTQINRTAEVSPSSMPSACPIPGPTETPGAATPIPSPGMTFMLATLGAAITIMIVKRKWQ